MDLGLLACGVGTALGVWVLVQGVVAIASRRGRGPGIAAVAVAVLAPIAFALTAYAGLSAGFWLVLG